MPAYARDQQIRRLLQTMLSSTTEHPGEDLRIYAEENADPIIDARLEQAGLSPPFAQPHTIICLISAQLAVAAYLRANVARYTGDEIESAVGMETRALQLLEDVATGKLSIGADQGDSADLVDYISQGEDQHVDSVFVGSVDNWKEPTETRASS